MENDEQEETANQSTDVATTTPPSSVKVFFAREDVRAKFQEMLGKRSTSFITSVLQIVSSSDKLAKADVTSIYNSAAVAATLDLPLNASLGFAYIVPYNNKMPDGKWRQIAQFQLGYKGLKQLALRSGQFLTLHSTDVREDEIKSTNRLTGEMVFAWIQDEQERKKKKVVGYVSYFKLINGYEQTFYMTIDDLEKHGKRYSQSFKKGFGLWIENFDSMCMKTITKLNLSKNAPLSVEMQKAVIMDQAVINDVDTNDVTYVDNDQTQEEEITADTLAALLIEKEALMDAKAQAEAKRIIFTPEPNSFKKLHKKLLAIEIPKA